MFGCGAQEMLLLVVAFIFAPFFINYSLAKSRGRKKDMCLWMLFTVFFSWITTLILLILNPKNTEAFNRECPYCKEVIKKGAIVCRYCGKDIVEPKPEPQGTETLIQPHEPAKTEPPNPVQQQSEPKPEPIQEKIISKSGCRNCGMEMPKHKTSCLYYRKKQGWPWAAKIFVALLITVLIIVVITILINVSTAPNIKNLSDIIQIELPQSFTVSNPESIIRAGLKKPESWKLRSLKYKDGTLICGTSAYLSNKFIPVWYAKGERIYAVNGAANSINTTAYEFVSSDNSSELGTSISDIVAVCEK